MLNKSERANLSIEIDGSKRSVVGLQESIRYHHTKPCIDSIGSNALCCSGKRCCRILCCGPFKCGIPIRAHPRIGNIFLHVVCITIAFVFAYAKVPYNASFEEYLVAINTPYVDPVELAFMKEFGISEKPPSRRLQFINRFLKAGGGAGGGKGGGGGGDSSQVINANGNGNGNFADGTLSE